jgi:hypothetical protein
VIPRVFHQVWLGSDTLPVEFVAYQDSWRRHHPDWELKLWGEDNLPADLRRTEVYDTERQPVERADILRLELIWRFGGVYLDTDYECLKPIDGLLAGVEFFTGTMKEAAPPKPPRVNNAIFGAVPGHPLLDRGLDELTVHEIGARYDKHLSGAMFFNALVIDAPGVTIFPRTYFYPTTEEDREEAFGIHHASRLWHDTEGLYTIIHRAESRLAKTTQRLEKEQRLRTRDRLLHEQEVGRLELEIDALRKQLAARTDDRGEALSILFFLRSIHFDRMFEPLLRELLERGHSVHVLLSTEKRGLDETKTKIFEDFREQYRFTYEQLPRRQEPWLRTAVALRHGTDYMRYLEPEFADAEPLRERARDRAPALTRTLLSAPVLRSRAGRRVHGAVLRSLEAAVPVPPEIKELIEARRPDVVLVSPLVGMGSTEGEFIRAAQELGIPTVLPVSSWDNLTNKGVLRDVPTTTIVWNEAQVEEAVRLHGLPREQVVAVGAHSFDHWFGWSPSTTRKGFSRARGLDPRRPILLYLGSSYFIAGDETTFIREWLARVRAHPRLAEAAVILRPHPQNGVGWDKLRDEPGRTVVWPRTPTAPSDDEKRADYFDTLTFADAVVGINTSGMLEAAILHRPVFTMISGHFTTQEGTLHFSYLAGDDEQGPVVVAHSWDEHLEQLATAIAAPGVDDERLDAFVRSFVRPAGLDVPAAPAAADAVEAAAATATAPGRAVPLALRGLLVALTPLAVLSGRVADNRRDREKATKREQDRLQKQDLRTQAATDVWREREERIEAKSEAKAAERAERDRARQEKQRAREEKARIAGAEPKAAEGEGKSKSGRTREEKVAARAAKDKARTLERQDAKQARSREKDAAKAAARAAKRRKAVVRAGRRRWKTVKRGVVGAYNVRYRLTYRSTTARVPSRNEIPALLNSRGLRGRGAEIGVRDGRFSDQLLSGWKGSLLISIDPWLADDSGDYVDASNVSSEEHERLYLETQVRLARHGDRSEIWRATSLEAAARIPDGSLDFAYIDARHDYASVLEDLAAWLPKVRPGGILAGHDYVDIDFGRTDFGVRSAVDEFFAARHIPVSSTDGPSAVELFPSWIVEVPGAGGPARNGGHPAVGAGSETV